MKVARTETGSVAEISTPYAKDSLRVSGVLRPVVAIMYINKEVTTIAMPVPTKAYIRILPKFVKKMRRFRLYPDSKIIGGRRTRMNILKKSFSIWFTSALSPRIKLSTMPATTPMMVVRPASCKYLE